MRFLSCKKKYLHEMEVSYLPNTNKRPSDIDCHLSMIARIWTPQTVPNLRLLWLLPQLLLFDVRKHQFIKGGQWSEGYPSDLCGLKKYIHVHYMAIFVTPPPNKNPEPLPQGQWIWQFKTRSLWHITMYLVYLLRLWKYRRIYST